MIFCSITKQKNQKASSYFYHKLLASTLKSTTDLNSCPHSLHPPSYFNGCHPFHPFPPWSSTKQDSYNQQLFSSKQKNPSFNSIFPFSYQQFLCSPSQQNFLQDLPRTWSLIPLLPWSHQGYCPYQSSWEPFWGRRWSPQTTSPLPVQRPVLCTSLTQQPTTSSFLKHILHLVSGIPLSWFSYFSGHSF